MSSELKASELKESKQAHKETTTKGLVVLDWDKTILKNHSHNIIINLINSFNIEVTSESLASIQKTLNEKSDINTEDATALFKFLNENLDQLNQIAARFRENKSKNLNAALTLNQAMTDLLPLIHPFISPVGSPEVWHNFFKECEQQGYNIAIVTWGSVQSKNILLPFYLEHIFKLDKNLRDKIYIEPKANPGEKDRKNLAIQRCNEHFGVTDTLIFGDDTAANVEAAKKLKISEIQGDYAYFDHNNSQVFKNYEPLVANQTEPVCLKMSEAMKKFSAESVEHVASSSSTTSVSSSVSTTVLSEQSFSSIEKEKISSENASAMIKEDTSKQNSLPVEEQKGLKDDSTATTKEEKKNSNKLYALFPTPEEVKQNPDVVLSDHNPAFFTEIPWGVKPFSFNVMSPQAPVYGTHILNESSTSKRPERVANYINAAVKQNGFNLIVLQELSAAPSGLEFFNGSSDSGWTGRLKAQLEQPEIEGQPSKKWNRIYDEKTGLAILCARELGTISHPRVNEEERYITATLKLQDGTTVEVTNVYLKHDVDPGVHRALVDPLLEQRNALVLGDFNDRMRPAPVIKEVNMVNNLVSAAFISSDSDLPQGLGCDSTVGCVFREEGGLVQQGVRVQLNAENAKPREVVALDPSNLTPRQQHELDRLHRFLDMDPRLTAIKAITLNEGGQALTCAEYEATLKQQRRHLVNEKPLHNFSVAFVDSMRGKHQNNFQPTMIGVQLPYCFFAAVKAELLKDKQLDPVQFDMENRQLPGCFYVPVELFPKFHQLVERIYPGQIATAKNAVLAENKNVEARLQNKQTTDNDWQYSRLESTPVLFRIALLNRQVADIEKLLDTKNYPQAYAQFNDLMEKIKTTGVSFASDVVTQDEANQLYSEFRQFVQNLNYLGKDMAGGFAKMEAKPEELRNFKELKDRIIHFEQILDKTPDRVREVKGKAPKVESGRGMENCLRAMAASKNKVMPTKMILPVVRTDVEGMISKLKAELKSPWYNKEARGLTLFKALHNFQPLPAGFNKADLLGAMKELVSCPSYLEWFSKYENVKDLGKVKAGANPKEAEALSVNYSMWRKFEAMYGESITKEEGLQVLRFMLVTRENYEKDYSNNPVKVSDNSSRMFNHSSAPASGVNPQPQQNASSHTSNVQNFDGLNVFK